MGRLVIILALTRLGRRMIACTCGRLMRLLSCLKGMAAKRRHVIRTWECAKVADVVGVLRQRSSSCSVHFILSLEGLQLDIEPCQDTSKQGGLPWKGIQAKLIQYADRFHISSDFTLRRTRKNYRLNEN